jgi:hypothetical protein
MDAKRVGVYARFAICVEVALGRVASFRKQWQIEMINFHVVALAKSANIRYVPAKVACIALCQWAILMGLTFRS